jgi:predicted RNase H-like HicB family nuclease
LDLNELLSIPYLLEAEAVETEPGQWLVRLAYPELPGCAAEGPVVEEALKALERQRIEMIIAMVEEGREPPIPRAPLATSDPLWTARDLGLSERLVALLAKPGATAFAQLIDLTEDVHAHARRQ